jgi:S1-C subfamily serine protease
MRRFVTFGPALVVLVSVAALLIGAPALVRGIASANTSARIVLAQQTLRDDDILERMNTATRAIADTVRPSVVHIEVTPAGERGWRIRSNGTGWVYDDAGHIVTNAHVVRGAESVSIQFPDGRVVQPEKIRGEAFLADPFTDIAVLKIPKGDYLFPAKRATGVMPQQGDRVFAFGSPFGFKFSMTQGIVGGVGRDPQTANEFGGYTNYIQHDASVNPGNSGGPLVDVRGRVIGMNVAIATGRDSQGTTGEGQSAGISFAIPVGTIESIAGQLIEKGDVSRGFLGVRWAGADDSAVYEPGVRRVGLRVMAVENGGPAKQAGMEAGDIITDVAGMPVTSNAMVRSIVTSLRPGTAIDVRAWRDGKEHDLKVTLAELPKSVLVDQGRVWREFLRFGLAIRDSEEGPKVQQVTDDSEAQSAGFEAGQVVLKVNDREVKTFKDVQTAALDGGLLVGRRVTFVVSATTEHGMGEPKELELRLTR